MAEEIKGKLEAFWETGTEGIIWSVYDETKNTREGLHSLRDGDLLRVFNDAAHTELAWQGVIDLEYVTNYQKFPKNPQYGQQAVGGCWVHGVQRNLDPELWMHMFTQEKHCILIKKPNPLPH